METLCSYPRRPHGPDQLRKRKDASLMSAAPSFSYDEFPYPDYIHPEVHPDLLAVDALLHGLAPAPIAQCRVLELGCGGGANLISLAAALPASRFVGIDLSARQIESGQAFIKELGLSNIELRAANVMELGEELGVFDYIFCHGIYSWVPPQVAERILDICARALAPHGVAQVSYNTYPGFHKRQHFREMIQYHAAAAGVSAPPEVAKRGLALLEFLFENVGDPDSANARLLRDELKVLRSLHPSYLFHDLAEAHNHPCYFHEFMSRASAHGLQFLSERMKKGRSEKLSAAAQQTLNGFGGDIVQREQYLDFIYNTSFRCTLLCRSGLSVVRPAQPQSVMALRSLAVARPEKPVSDVNAREPVVFHVPGFSANIEHPSFKALLIALDRARPRALAFSELGAQLGRLLGKEVSESELCQMVLYGQNAGVLSLHTWEPQLSAKPSERPRASLLARMQAAHNRPIANLWHQPLQLDSVELEVLKLLDGSRDNKAILAALIEAVERGTLSVQHSTGPRKGIPRKTLAARLPEVLALFAAGALLEA